MAFNASSKLTLDTRKFMRNVETKVAKGMEDAAEEIVKKAKQYVPVDTGNLKRSIDYEMDKTRSGITVRIYADMEYSIYVEMGTRFQNAQPYLRPALFNNRTVILRKVVGR